MEELIHKIGDKVTTINTILGKGHSTPTSTADHGTVKDIELLDYNLVRVVIEYEERWEVESVFSVEEFNQNIITTAFNAYDTKDISTIFFE